MSCDFDFQEAFCPASYPVDILAYVIALCPSNYYSTEFIL